MATAKTLVWHTENDTQTFANALASRLLAIVPAGHASLFLYGDLGAGKSTFARYLLQALRVQGRIKSPTYAIVESYLVHLADRESSLAQELPIWHFDFYRFQDPEEWESAGFRDIFASVGLKLVEWPQKALGFLPEADLVIRLQPELSSETMRSVQLEAQTATGRALLA